MNGDVLICGPNWLGDGIMSMPAVRALRRRRPDACITLLVKSRVLALWRMQPAVDRIIELGRGAAGILRAARAARASGARSAVLFPNSLRSALVPFLAGIPERAGTRGHMRRRLLTRVVRTVPAPGREHQVWEYMILAGCGDEREPEPPRLAVPPAAVARIRERIGAANGAGWVAIIPGAARGPSKRWPAEHFAVAGRRLAAQTGCRVAVLGTEAEREACRRIATAVGNQARTLAGETGLEELAALLSICRVALTNDSGGMHLAAAVGTRVVAVFGLTDPQRTGPIGAGHRVVTPEGEVRRARDIARGSEEAALALRSIAPERVVHAALEIMGAEK